MLDKEEIEILAEKDTARAKKSANLNALELSRLKLNWMRFIAENYSTVTYDERLLFDGMVSDILNIVFIEHDENRWNDIKNKLKSK